MEQAQNPATMKTFNRTLALLALCLPVAGLAQVSDFEYRRRANDPGAVEIPFGVGTPISTVLERLKEKGYRIKYRDGVVTPEMKVTVEPTQTRVNLLLREILTPHNLRAHNTAEGDWIISPVRRTATAGTKKSSR